MQALGVVTTRIIFIAFILVSFAAVISFGPSSSRALPTNGCSLEHYIPFPKTDQLG